MWNHRSLHAITSLTAVLSSLVFPHLLSATVFTQTNLVSDVPGLAANTDPHLVNPWGLSFSATSPFWAANQGSGTSTLYDGAGNINALVVSIPGATTPPTGPTGTVFNSATGFLVNGTPASFLFDTLNGTIAGWNGGTVATTEVTTPGAVYTGLAQATSGGNSFLYAADSTGQVRVFNSTYQPVTLAGNFTDPNAIAGFVPFNIQSVGTSLYVTYAQLTMTGAPLPGGYVDVFNTDGTFSKRLTTGGALEAPWGITLAPSTFGSFANDVLVGNFGNGEINAYDPTTGAFVGTIDGANGLPIVNDFLWALDFRTGGANDNPNALYFTAGINGEQAGLFGDITVAPEPASTALGLLGLTGLVLLRKRLIRHQG
jgi:uncharacterized protein (TIGR03118 family)